MDKRITKNKRITVKLKSPNPLFEKWLLEWRDKAAENNSKMQFTFNIALNSLRKYPIPLNSGKECLILKGFGQKLCDMLDQKLKNHKKDCQNNLDATMDYDIEEEEELPKTKKKRTPKLPKSPAKSGAENSNLENLIPNIAHGKIMCNSTNQKSPQSKKSYLPTYRSGSCAILLALLKMSEDPNAPESPTKTQLIQVARQYCDVSFTKPDPGSFYTAWSSMGTLVNKNLVEKKGNPAKFNLTPEGFEVAFKLLDVEEKNEVNLQVGINNKKSESIYESLSQKENRPSCSKTSDSQNGDFSTSSQLETKYGISGQKKIKLSEVPKACSSKKINEDHNKGENLSNSQTNQSPNFAQTQSQQSHSQSQIETVIFAPGSFDVILLVDNQETEGKKVTALDDDTKYELNQSKIHYEIRHLKVGDFTWICRERGTNFELVLPYIVERKRLDDLARSITDGRFHEQKHRLKSSGINNLIYVIENITQRQKMVKTDKIGALPLSTLEQAAANTLVQDGFQVKFTNNHRHTMAYLATFSRFLVKYYSNKTVMSTSKDNITSKINLNDDLQSLLTFKVFNKTSSKQRDFTVREMFIKQLVQLKGVSVDKAIGITNVYGTPRLLMDEYERIDNNFAPMLLAKLCYGPFKRQIGAVISKTLHQFYTKDQLL